MILPNSLSFSGMDQIFSSLWVTSIVSLATSRLKSFFEQTLVGAFSPSLRPFRNDKNAHTVARGHPASDQAADKRGTRRTPFRNLATVQLLVGGDQATVAWLRSCSRGRACHSPETAEHRNSATTDALQPFRCSTVAKGAGGFAAWLCQPGTLGQIRPNSKNTADFGMPFPT